MTRIIGLSLIFIGSFITIFAQPTLLPVFTRIGLEIDQNSTGYLNLKKATETIGHRLSGTSNGNKAEQMAYQLFRKAGFQDVIFQPFEMKTWQRDSVFLEVVPYNSDNYIDFKAVALAHTPILSSINAQIIDLKNGMPEDFKLFEGKLKGKIVLMDLNPIDLPADRPNLHRSEKTALAILAGAAGVIMANSVAGQVLLTGTASVTGELIGIPAVCVSLETAKQLRNWLAQEKLQAHIFMKNNYKKVVARNIICTLKGSSKVQEIIVIGAHLDSWDLATGAIDNGIGAFTVLEIARVFKTLALKTNRTIQFVLFMGEEQGLHGSKHMVRMLQKQNKISQISYMINLDMPGNARGFNICGRSEAKDFFVSTGKQIALLDSSFYNKIENQAYLHSDHQPFMLNGIAVCNPIADMPKSVYDCYHADCDRLDLVKKAYISHTAKYTAMMLYALANTDVLPAKKLTDSENKDFLVSQNLKQKLILGKDWHGSEKKSVK